MGRSGLLPIVIIAVLAITAFTAISRKPSTPIGSPPTPSTAQAPASYQISNVPYYSRKNFCYEASMMMQLRYFGLSEQEVSNFKKILDEKGKGGPPDAFIGLMNLHLIPKVRLAYAKNYDQKFANFYKQTFGLSNSQITTLTDTNAALTLLKQLVSSSTPVGALIQKGNHYVVVTGYDDQFIYLSDPDPDYGKRKMATADFIADWTNYKQDIRGDQIGFPAELGMLWLTK